MSGAIVACKRLRERVMAYTFKRQVAAADAGCTAQLLQPAGPAADACRRMNPPGPGHSAQELACATKPDFVSNFSKNTHEFIAENIFVKSKSKINKLIEHYGLLFLFWSFILTALVVFSIFIRISYWSHISSNFEKTQGHLLQSNLYESLPTGRGSGNIKQSQRWNLKVEYRYRVGNKEYISDRLNLSKSGGGEEIVYFAKSLDAAIKNQTMIDVYYYKFNPAKSVLIKEDTEKGKIATLIGFSIFCLLAFFTRKLMRM